MNEPRRFFKRWPTNGTVGSNLEIVKGGHILISSSPIMRLQEQEVPCSLQVPFFLEVSFAEKMATQASKHGNYLCHSFSISPNCLSLIPGRRVGNLANSQRTIATKRKRDKKQDEKVWYEIEVEDWEVDYHFGLNTVRKHIEGIYWESPKLILIGKILSPVLEKAGKARIEIAAEPQMDDYWQEKPTIISAKAIGWMEIPRGDDMLIFYCSIPSRSFQYIALAADSGRIKFVSIFGTKLKRRQGTITSVNLSKHRIEE